MQFLAFLQDSYREIKSGWIFHIMLVLSTVMIVLVASVGFRPITVEDELNAHFGLMGAFMQGNPQLGRPTFVVENYSQTDKAEPWKSDYAFDFVIQCPSAADLKKAREAGLPVNPEMAEMFLRDSLPYVEHMDVTEVASPAAAAHLAVSGIAMAPAQTWEPREARYHVRTRGTKVQDALAWRHQVSILFAFDVPVVGIMSLRQGVYRIEKWLVNNIMGWLLLLVSVVVTAGFIPNLLTKGALDLAASKPIGRSRLLIYKYLGGLTFVWLLTAYAVTGVWLMIGIRSSVWSPNLLAIIPVLTFYFAILYSVSTLSAVITRNALVAILMTGLAWGLFYGIGQINNLIGDRLDPAQPEEVQRGGRNQPAPQANNPDAPLFGIPKSVYQHFPKLHAITPRTFELDDRMGRMIAEGVLTENELKASPYSKPPKENWLAMLGVSSWFIFVVLGSACWRFSRRDF